MFLKADNSTITKYKFNDGRYEYITNPAKNSRRWYGEVYIPASTIVAEKGATTTDLSRSTSKVKKTGYLILVFEDITTTLTSGQTYLQYSIGRDSSGTQFSPNASGRLVSPSIMYNEKTNNGAQAIKSTITLPNGKTFSGFAETDAPIIIYDVSLRANNDYEETGTH